MVALREWLFVGGSSWLFRAGVCFEHLSREDNRMYLGCTSRYGVLCIVGGVPFAADRRFGTACPGGELLAKRGGMSSLRKVE